MTDIRKVAKKKYIGIKVFITGEIDNTIYDDEPCLITDVIEGSIVFIETDEGNTYVIVPSDQLKIKKNKE